MAYGSQLRHLGVLRLVHPWPFLAKPLVVEAGFVEKRGATAI